MFPRGFDSSSHRSSHAAHDFDNGLFVDHDYAPAPAKPTLVGEPRYETLYDPRYGIASPIHTDGNAGVKTFTPPTSGQGNDWLLVLDDVTSNFPLPGTIRE